jgi:peptidoglycan/LPS O-acetylase OafA/YrhL
VDGILIYFWWNIWKERNRRIFQQKILIQDKWLLFARMKLCNIGWLRHQDIKRLQLIKRVVALGSFSLVVLVISLAPPTSPPTPMVVYIFVVVSVVLLLIVLQGRGMTLL